MIRNMFAFVGPHVARRLALVTAAVLLAAAPASAALIVDSLHYDGIVRSGGTSGVEAHFKNFVPDLAPPVGFDTLPADNTLINGLTPGNNLTIGITEAALHSIITINRAGTGDIFNNQLDGTIPLPVLFDGLFYSNNIDADEKIVVSGVTIEEIPAEGVPPFPSPGPATYTGKGTQANPLRIQFGIPANLVESRNGAAKIHIFYSLMQIPEPTSAGLALLGLLGVATFGRRR
jgi:hypothetical protein